MKKALSYAKEFFHRADIFLLVMGLICATFGIIVISSATASYHSAKYVIVQSASLILGVVAFVAMTVLDVDVLADKWQILCAFNALFLLLLLNTIRIIKSKLNPTLEIEGFLLTMYDARLRLANQIYDELKGHFGDMVFDTVIPRNIRLSEAPSHGLPAILYDPTSRGATSHTQLAKELEARNSR